MEQKGIPVGCVSTPKSEEKEYVLEYEDVDRKLEELARETNNLEIQK